MSQSRDIEEVTGVKLPEVCTPEWIDPSEEPTVPIRKQPMRELVEQKLLDRVDHHVNRIECALERCFAAIHEYEAKYGPLG